MPLNFGERRGRRRFPSAARLLLLVVAAAVLTVYLWLGPPAGRPVAPFPAPGATRPVRPPPTSLPALSAEDLTVLAEVRDREPVRDLPFYYLLHRARTAATRPAPAIPVEAEDLLDHPAAYRGQLVRLQAVFLREYLVELPENLAGLRGVRQGELGTTSGTIVTYVLAADTPSDRHVGDDVALGGYFLQVRRFVSAADGRGVEGPLLIAPALLSPVGR